MSTCINKGDHLWVEVNGTYSLKLLLSAVHEISDRCQRENLNKVLVDLRKMEGSRPSIFDRFQIGMEIVRLWGSGIETAVVARPGIINRVAENTAMNRGVKLYATTSQQDAARWLGIEFQDQTIGE